MNQSQMRPQLVGEVVERGDGVLVQPMIDRTEPPLAPSDSSALEPGAVVLARRDTTLAYVEQLLAPAGSALAAVYRIAAEHGLDPLFPGEVLDELSDIEADPGIDASDLEDLTSLAFCTIDGADTRDLDQALYIESTQHGYRVWYALADAAAFVRPGSALFDEALRRGASFYLPGLVVPMLPKALSEGLVSLNPELDRRALVFELSLDTRGQCTRTRLHRARIHSRAKLSFEAVQDFLDDPRANPIRPPALASSLTLLREVGELRLEDRRARDVVRYRRSEVRSSIGADPMRFVVIDALRNDVERYNEELSLLCNVEGARFLMRGDREDDHVQPIYRVHPEPDTARMRRFEATIEQLIRCHALDPETWQYRSQAAGGLARYLSTLPTDGRAARIAAAIHRQAIMVNARSAFSQRAGGHYGVGADVYARFSAPMREIVGVFLHKEALEKLEPTSTSSSYDEDEALRQRIVERANEAKRIQALITGAANRQAIDQVLREADSAGRHGFDATVMGMARDRVYLRLDAPGIEVKAYLRDLAEAAGEALEMDEHGVELRGRRSGTLVCRLGDGVEVRVSGHDAKRDRWKLRIAPPGG